MPVTIRPSSCTAVAWDNREKSHRFTHAASPEQLLSLTTSDDSYVRGKSDGAAEKRRTLVQSSFAQPDQKSALFAAKNGLVFACLEAYNDHHNLVIRPDDVWLAILTQLSAYVNANAEDLRDLFVDHSGQKGLHIEAELKGIDHGRMAFLMSGLMADGMKDPSLRGWVLPAFSTTDKNDEAVASIVFMGTMQKYFTYSWGTRCGIPAVTLLGEADDWVEIAQRCADRLGSGGFGEGARRWYRVLQPVLEGFLETFRDPDGEAALAFWQGIVNKHDPNGSGTVAYSGWITAFCYWNEKGECLHEQKHGAGSRGPRLTRSQIPMGFSKVPVTLMNDGVIIPTEMVAGSVAIKAVQSRSEPPPSEGGVRKSRGGVFDTIQPESGWFMYLT